MTTTWHDINTPHGPAQIAFIEIDRIALRVNQETPCVINNISFYGSEYWQKFDKKTVGRPVGWQEDFGCGGYRRGDKFLTDATPGQVKKWRAWTKSFLPEWCEKNNAKEGTSAELANKLDALTYLNEDIKKLAAEKKTLLAQIKTLKGNA